MEEPTQNRNLGSGVSGAAGGASPTSGSGGSFTVVAAPSKTSTNKVRPEIQKSVLKKPTEEDQAMKPGVPKHLKFWWKTLFAVVFPILVLIILGPFMQIDVLGKGTSELARGGAIMAIIIGLWLTEALPLPVTALIPIFAAPVFGLISSEEMVENYMNDLMILFLGALSVALAFEYSNLHRRLALRIIMYTGTSPNMLLLGICLTCGFLSLFMNNTSVASMMLPIVVALMDTFETAMLTHVLREVETAPMSEMGIGESETSEALASNAESLPSPKFPVQAGQPPPMTGNAPGAELKAGPVPPTFALSGMSLSKYGPVQHSQLSMDTNPSLMSISVSREKEREAKEQSVKTFLQGVKTMLLLGVAWSANIAGTGMISGSGTNLILLKEQDKPVYRLGYADSDGNAAVKVGFLNFMGLGMVSMFFNFIFLYLFLIFWFSVVLKWWRKTRHRRSKRLSVDFEITREVHQVMETAIRERYRSLGSISLHEILTAVLFALMVVLWVTINSPNPEAFPLWGDGDKKMPVPSMATAAAIPCMLAFIIPRKSEFYFAALRGDFKSMKYETVMDWRFFNERFPWGVILLLGGGFGLSTVASKSGILEEMTAVLAYLRPYINQRVLLLVVIYMAIFGTEVASNTALASLFLPVLFESSRKFGIHPQYLAFPSTIACSYAFMFPVATPPNALVFTAGKMKIFDMFIPGFVLNIVSGLILFAVSLGMGEVVFHYDSYDFKGCYVKLATPSNVCPGPVNPGGWNFYYKPPK